MKTAAFVLLCAAVLCCANLASAQSYDYQANIAAQIDGDFANVTGARILRRQRSVAGRNIVL